MAGLDGKQALKLLKLSKKQDGFYDRPTIGQLKQLGTTPDVNPLVSQLERLMRTTVDRGHQTLDVVDLGSGTEPLPGQLHSLQQRWLTFGVCARVIVHE